MCLAIGIVGMWFPLLPFYKGSSVCRLTWGGLGMLLALETTQSRVELRCAINGSTMSYGARISQILCSVIFWRCVLLSIECYKQAVVCTSA